MSEYNGEMRPRCSGCQVRFFLKDLTRFKFSHKPNPPNPQGIHYFCDRCAGYVIVRKKQMDGVEVELRKYLPLRFNNQPYNGGV